MTIIENASAWPEHKPTALLVLADGTVLEGFGLGAEGQAVGEVCFNTAMTGYEEILTDPSYAGQIITFTFPHVGNVGTNLEDIESINPAARGVVLRGDITEPANWRAAKPLDDWLKGHNLPGVCGVDTRAITRRIRDGGAPSGVVVPRAALVRHAGLVFIYEQTGKEEFTRRPVTLEQPVPAGWFTGTGLKPGVSIVISGAQTLLSEELKGQGGEE